MNDDVSLVQVDDGASRDWASRLPDAPLLAWRVVEAEEVAVWPGEGSVARGVRCGTFAVLCLSGSDSDATAMCVELCLRPCASLRELALLAHEKAAALCVSALVAARSEGGEWLLLAVRSVSFDGCRLWSVAGEAAAEHLPTAQLPKRRGVMGLRRGRGAVFVSCTVVRHPDVLLFGSGPELAFPQDFGATLKAAAHEDDVLGHLAASSTDGFGGGAVMLCCEVVGCKRMVTLSRRSCPLVLDYVRARAEACASSVTLFAQSAAAPKAPFALHGNVPLAVSIAQTATQLIIMCQTLSSATLNVSAGEQHVAITMTFPDEPRIRAEMGEGDCVAMGAAEFFGPVTRTVALPAAIDPESKIMVYDRTDGIVNIKYDLLA